MEHLVVPCIVLTVNFAFNQEFYTQQGEWLHVFEEPLPRAVSNEQLKVNNTNFTIEEVKDWVERHGSVNGRFLFFETFVPNNEFYQKVAKPLLSMRTVGSMDVQRIIKPIKQDILTKKGTVFMIRTGWHCIVLLKT